MRTNRLGLTAELAALIKSERDPDYRFFVSDRTKRLERIADLILPARTIKAIFDWRNGLTDLIDREIDALSPVQIVELGAGFSLRGIKMAIDHPEIDYYDTDTNEVIKRKGPVLEELLRDKGLPWPANYRLMAIDLSRNDFIAGFDGALDQEKLTAIIAEGVTTYFDRPAFASFLKNIGRLLALIPNSTYISHGSTRPGTGAYGPIRRLLSLMTGSRGVSFANSADLNRFLNENSGGIVESKSVNGHFIYTIRKGA